MTSAVLILGLFAFMILNVPVGIAIGLASTGAILVGGRLSLSYIPQALVTGTDSFPIMAIPLFILAGELMGNGGISKRLLDVADALLGHITGGLAIVTVAVCMFFAAVSGSGPATVAAVGSMVVPGMLALGYDMSFILALIAAAGSIGVIIPPSIPMIIYGVSTSTSISTLFIAGFIPGILIGLSLMVFCYIYCKKKGWKGNGKPFSGKRFLSSVWLGKWALIDPVIILGGIYSGIFTPTEAAAVAAVYAFVCGLFIYKEFTFKSLMKTIGNACSTTGTVMVILGCATAFTKILTLEQVPLHVANAITALTTSRVLVLIMINVLLLIVGCFMDTTPAMMVLAPILLPIAVQFGLSPVQFGLIMVVNLSIGFITPPLGINLFVAARVGNTTLDNVVRGIIPFFIINILDLLLITYIPAITMFLPHMFGVA